MKKVTFVLALVGVVLMFLSGCIPQETRNFTLTMLEPSGNGNLIPTVGEHTYQEGSVVDIKATPDTGWQFVKWEVNGDEYSTDAETTITINDDKEVKAYFELIPPTEYTLTMLEPSGNGNVIPTVGEHTYQEGSVVDIKATPDTGWQFVKWEVNGDEYSTDAETTITINDDKEVKAYFELIPPTEYTLTMLEPTGNGNVIPTVGEHTYEEGSVVDIKATPDTGWQFVKWEVNGDEYSTDAETTITINDDKEVKAYFELIPPTEYTLTMLEPSGNGSVIPTVGGHTYQEGSVVDIKATPDTGWQFVKWEVNGDEYSTDAETTITINDDKEVKAYFELIPPTEYTLTMLEPSGNGSVIPTVGEHTYQEGSVVDIKATPDTGWQFVKWEVNGDEYSTDAETTITINDDKEVKAYFELIPLEIGVPYTAANGLTVTLNSFEIIEVGNYYEYKIDYTQKNNTDNYIDEGSFKLFYLNNEGGIPQYGFFSRLRPGGELRRTYTFAEEKSILFGILAYHHDAFGLFFASYPPEDALIWEVKY